MAEEPIPIDRPRPRFFADHWHNMRKWWSLKIGAAGILIIGGAAAIQDQIPSLQPILLGWFPTHGQQWVPMFILSLTVICRMLSQSALVDALLKIFGINRGDHESQ